MEQNLENLTIDEQLDTAAPVWPALSEDDVAKAWQLFDTGIESAINPRIKKHALRMMTSGAIIECQDQLFFMKRSHSSVITKEQLVAKHKFANLIGDRLRNHYMNKGGAPDVVQYYKAKSGGTVVSIGEWLYELQNHVKGDVKYGDNYCWDPAETSAEIYGLGVALAKMHLATEDVLDKLPKDYQSCLYDWHYGFIPQFSLYLNDEQRQNDCIAQFLQSHPKLKNWLKEQNHDLQVDLVEYLYHPIDAVFKEIPERWIHADLHISNVSYEGNSVKGVFDFGLSCPSSFIADLATALDRNTIRWLSVMEGNHDAYSADDIKSLMAGYQSVRKLTPAEKTVLPQMMSNIHIEPALHFIEYHLNTKKPENAEWSYDIFFKRHSKWYITDSGKKYLAVLRDTL